MGAKLLFEDVREKVEELGYRLITDCEDDLVRENNRLYINVVDSNGYKYFCDYQNIKNNHPPLFVCNANTHSLENISRYLKINNKKFELCDDNIYNHSEKQLKFYCSICDDVFYMNWHGIISGQNCAICAGKQTGEKYSLRYLRPDLAKEWFDFNNNLNPDNVTQFSSKNILWKCSVCTYEWMARIADRTINNSGCPNCAGQRANDTNRLTINHPKICKEWNYDKNGALKPENYASRSNVKVWWKCINCEHEWKTSIDSRTNGTDCPRCAQELIESKVATQCKQYFKDNYNAIPEYKLFKNPLTNQWLKCDIYIPDNIFVEIHGGQHYINNGYFHKTEEEFEKSQYRDKIKKEYCENNGIYIEIDIRNIKTSEDAIKYIERIIN